eukprot:scpid97886/ scgid24062/ 
MSAVVTKHPHAAEPPTSALLDGDPGQVNNIAFRRITPELVRRIARQMRGASGPLGLDSDAWCRMLTCYKKSSGELCTALAHFSHRLYSEDLDPEHLAAFTAARLIPLDKRPRVRLIAVGGRCFAELFAVRLCVCLNQTCLGQLYVGVPFACEAGVHAAQELFQREDVEGILFVDA